MILCQYHLMIAKEILQSSLLCVYFFTSVNIFSPLKYEFVVTLCKSLYSCLNLSTYSFTKLKKNFDDCFSCNDLSPFHINE